MVIDKLKNAAVYYGLGPHFETALRYIGETDFSEMESGRYDIDGDNVYAFVQRYTTAPADENQTEGHERYADIHLVFSGRERMGYTPIDTAVPTGERIPEADMVFYRPLEQFFPMEENTFCIMWPQDIHEPRCILDAPADVVKILVKVRIF